MRWVGRVDRVSGVCGVDTWVSALWQRIGINLTKSLPPMPAHTAPYHMHNKCHTHMYAWISLTDIHGHRSVCASTHESTDARAKQRHSASIHSPPVAAGIGVAGSVVVVAGADTHMCIICHGSYVYMRWIICVYAMDAGSMGDGDSGMCHTFREPTAVPWCCGGFVTTCCSALFGATWRQ